MAKFWMVRSGKGGVHVNEFVSLGVAAIGWEKLGPLEKGMSRDEIARRYLSATPLDSIVQARNVSSQIDRFINEVSIGDTVITYNSILRIYYLGTVESDVIWNTRLIPGLPRIRKTTWTGYAPRDLISSKHIGSLGALLTVFGLKSTVAEDMINHAVFPINEIGG